MHIVNIRGTNGAGKTTLIRDMMGLPMPAYTTLCHYSAETKGERKEYLGGGHWIKDRNAVVVGDYTRKNGGCDGIKSQEGVVTLIDGFISAGNVETVPITTIFFEGLMVSGLFGSWIEAFKRWMKDGHIVTVAYLIPELEENLRRVKARSDRDYTAPDDAARLHGNVLNKLKGVQSTRAKFRTLSRSGEFPRLRVIDLPTDTSLHAFEVMEDHLAEVS